MYWFSYRSILRDADLSMHALIHLALFPSFDFTFTQHVVRQVVVPVDIAAEYNGHFLREFERKKNQSEKINCTEFRKRCLRFFFQQFFPA